MVFMEFCFVLKTKAVYPTGERTHIFAATLHYMVHVMVGIKGFGSRLLFSFISHNNEFYIVRSVNMHKMLFVC